MFISLSRNHRQHQPGQNATRANIQSGNESGSAAKAIGKWPPPDCDPFPDPATSFSAAISCNLEFFIEKKATSVREILIKDL